MFQYATGRAIAHRCRDSLLLDASGFASYELRSYELGELSIDSRVATHFDLLNYGIQTSKLNLLDRIRKTICSRKRINFLNEKSFAYDNRVEFVNTPLYLNGYWQSERYFEEVADIIRREFVLKTPLDLSNAAIADHIQVTGSNAVSLHIRRGDYVSNPHTAQYHGVCSIDYYQDAVRYIAERVSAPHFYVFSDDHAWAKENLKLDYAVTQVDINGADRGVYDMALMKACRHHIIANSSFSWWGAWLNPYPDKIVVAPQRWFSGASHDTSDLIPNSWVRL